MSAARMALAIRTRSLTVSVTLGPMSRQPGPRQAPASEHLKPILGGSISLPSVQSEGTQAKTPAIPSASGRTSLPEAKLGGVWEGKSGVPHDKASGRKQRQNEPEWRALPSTKAYA